MIYTGYYAKASKYSEAGLKVISISRTEPGFAEIDGKIWELCPSSDILWDHKEGRIGDEEYIERYNSQLDALGIRKVLTLIHHCGDDLVLTCWEAPGKFCHRHILADYINKYTKLEITEYKIN